ncbi:MAG: hypothetical protein IKC48_03300 [Clostridia bacterium]|nr:hypothetical protein [Clostridia bacterium]
MKKTISFFGHRILWNVDIRERVKTVLESYFYYEICCLIGTHGEFDRLALSVCRELRKSYSNIKITAVFSTLKTLLKDAYLYDDVETMIYEVEQEHFKNQITVSNRKMIDDSDLIICYVDTNKYRSGAKRAVEYATKQGKEVINLFREKDRPFYGMTKEEIESAWKK